MKITRKTLLIRLIIVAVWIALGALTFVTNRGHMLLIDNKDIPGHDAPRLITVYVDKGKGVEYFSGDRDRVNVTGTKHRIKIEFTDGTPDFEGEFSLPIKDDSYILSVPKMTAGIEPFVEVFRIAPSPPAEEETASGEGLEILAP